MLRDDLAKIADWVPERAHVLDLGCDDGALLAHLRDTRRCDGYGVEIADASVLASVRRGVNVIQADLESGLRMFADGMFDVVVLSQTLQAMRHVEAILLQTGSMAGYHWGAWLSNTSFAVGGWTEADDYGQWMQGQLWLYSLSDSTVSTYATRIISADVYARYEASWHGWLLKRYRAWKRSRSPA